ncbi:uncharacterized protein CHSO_4201 [Chryseobacterium sp. StRB126]|nr:uncharacterized protein CHSO_4201 [Chryseobacterium sp. StRB126]
MENSIKIGNHYYDINSEHFCLKREQSLSYINDLPLLNQFPNLTSASFSCSNLNDDGLAHISDCRKIEYLDVQDTEITNEGIKHLKKLENLKYLRLKENSQLTNDCIPDLAALDFLFDLQIHETSINEEGLKKFVALKNLEIYCFLENICINIRDNNYTFEGLLDISKKIPDCAILAKGNGEFLNGTFDGKWRHQKRE